MLTALVRGSLRYRTVVLILAVGLLAAGLYAARTAKYDVFPEFFPPLVVVYTEAPGFGPEEVESLVTRPIESSLNGTIGLETLRSSSIQGLSVVTAIFRDNMNALTARQLLSEKLSQVAGQLPQGVRPPVMAPLTSSSGIVLRVGMTGRGTSPMELRTLADWTIEPRLLAVPGVAYITTFGGEVRQYQVQVRPDRLTAYNIGLNEVLQAVREANGLVGAGFLENANQRITLRAEAGLQSLDQLSATVVAVHHGLPIRLGQVAEVTIGAEPKYGDASILGEPAVLMTVYKQLGSNTLDVSRAVEEAIDSLRAALPDDVELHPKLFRQANFIERALRNVNTALLQGSVLVIVVLLLFLANLRTALISLTAIPLSLLTAVGVLSLLGETINTLTLGGLAIAIGEVVDDAIIDVENIYRRLRENQAAEQPRPTLAVVLDASLEVRTAVVFATFIVALVFLPVLFLSGLQGKLFAPLGYAYVLSIMASLAVALTVTPAMSAVLLRNRRLPPGDTRLLGWSKRAYRALLGPTLGHPLPVGLAALLLFAAAAAVLPFLGGEFIPELNEGNYTIHAASLPGTSLAESLRVGSQLQKELADLPEVSQVCQQVGRAELSEDIWDTNYSEFQVEMKPLEGEEAETARDELAKVLVRYPGYYFSIKPFLTERIEEAISGTTGQVVVRIFGPDLDELDRLAQATAEVLRDVPGASNVVVEQQTGVPEFRFRANLPQCERCGVRPVQVLELLRTAVHGTTVNQVVEDNRVIDTVVKLTPKTRPDLETLRGIPVETPTGNVPLGNLVEITSTTGRALIAHEGTGRRALVQCNVRGRDVSGFLSDAREAVRRTVRGRKNYIFDFGGEAQAARTARDELLALSAAVLLGIAVLLYAALGSWRLMLLVLSNLPFALVGGVVAVVFSGGTLSIGAMVGFVTLFGISIRNSIMLISHYQHLVAEEDQLWCRETVVRGALERLGPILMTASVTALGLLPIALGGTSAGREVEQPMALVILGGLVTSTVLNLLVLPTLVGRFARLEKAMASSPGWSTWS
jgi:CzcA family heavy metal efflux pump